MSIFIVAIYDAFTAENKQYMVNATGWKEAIVAAYILKQGPDSDPEVGDIAFIVNMDNLEDIKNSFYDMELSLDIIEIKHNIDIAVGHIK